MEDREVRRYNEQRYNRKRQWYRVVLGVEQLCNYPLLNVIWVCLAIGMYVFERMFKRFMESFHVYSALQSVFNHCMTFIMIIIPIIFVIAIIQLLGYAAAVKDEADLQIVFGDKRNVKNNQMPILVHKKKEKSSGVTKREFYTTISMELWKESTEAICDIMNIHILGEITYGGRKKDKGNRIYFESAQNRKPKERGILYDDIF
ncbi:hypothetical protein [Coprococcus catus]|uniref:hypothetical protein n=1 Tax=Coprococcus catus TaxID=116085 RepID=UPI001C8C408F|nr:hypothetical protein [Coprococcus catus]MBX9230244.1 hypothetical protein [Coprococcus catus]MCT6798702.1 hypothetical protein [Coprococcus catus]